MLEQTLGIPLRDRNLTSREVEQVRLLLSTFCDGSGMTVKGRPGTYPDYLAFERVTAAITGGTGGEDKGIFDVTVPVPNQKAFGVSCKMAGPGLVRQSHCGFMELSNSAKKFEDDFLSRGYDWANQPAEAGQAVVELVESWHEEVRSEVDLSHSLYFLLTHSRNWQYYQLSTFDLNLRRIDPADLSWVTRNKRGTNTPNSVVGTWTDKNGVESRIWEFYPLSGGQLKYYPFWSWARWQSPPFTLEKPPIRRLSEQAELYFPELWNATLP